LSKPRSDEPRFSRRQALKTLGGCIAASAAAARAFALNTGGAADLTVRFDGDYLRIAAPHLTFLGGRELQRLKDGASVAFLAQLTLTTSPNSLMPLARSVARFALSYDIWEERFQVTRIGATPEARRSVSHLTEQAAQNWCIDNLTIDRSQLPADRPFYIQFDLRAEDPRDQLGIIGEPGINLTRLIEIFSRPARSAQPRWLMNAGPFRLADLLRAEPKGPRG
jgi:hypothetical protein